MRWPICSWHVVICCAATGRRVPALRQYVAQASNTPKNGAQSPTLSLADEISTPFRHGQPLVQTFLNVGEINVGGRVHNRSFPRELDPSRDGVRWFGLPSTPPLPFRHDGVTERHFLASARISSARGLDPSCRDSRTASASISGDALRKTNRRNEKRIYLRSAWYAVKQAASSHEDARQAYYNAMVRRLSRRISDG